MFNKTNKEIIAILNTLIRLKIAPSEIHGVGVFAITSIPKGVKLNADMFPQSFRIPYKDFGKLKPRVRALIVERWPKVVNNEPFMYPDTFLQGYMNHSKEPNYDAINDVTLKNIEYGEEITEDYTKILGWEEAYPWLNLS